LNQSCLLVTPRMGSVINKSLLSRFLNRYRRQIIVCGNLMNRNWRIYLVWRSQLRVSVKTSLKASHLINTSFPSSFYGSSKRSVYLSLAFLRSNSKSFVILLSWSMIHCTISSRHELSVFSMQVFTCFAILNTYLRSLWESIRSWPNVSITIARCLVM